MDIYLPKITGGIFEVIRHDIKEVGPTEWVKKLMDRLKDKKISIGENPEIVNYIMEVREYFLNNRDLSPTIVFEIVISILEVYRALEIEIEVEQMEKDST